MISKTLLSDGHILSIAVDELREHFDHLPPSIPPFARAIEQVVLQSTELRALIGALQGAVDNPDDNAYWIHQAKTALAAFQEGGGSMIAQAGIAFFGVSAIWLSQSRNESARRYACLLGLAGQPFWFWTAYSSQQWGILLLCCFYTVSWVRGVKTFWFGPHKESS